MTRILILVSFMLLPDFISGGTTEERRRAATVSALRHHSLPPQLLRSIASNGHVTRDCEELEMGFFPQNEWKALKRVFKRTERTAGICHVIDQYDDARAAWDNSPAIQDRDWNGPFGWWKQVRRYLCITIESPQSSTEIYLKCDDFAIMDICPSTLNEGDIRDLSYLPKHLRRLSILHGEFTMFELIYLTHPGPKAESKLHIQSLPPGLESLTMRKCGDLRRRKEDPLEVHFNLPLPQGLNVWVPRMDGLIFHPAPAAIDKVQRERMWPTWKVKWDDGSQIQVNIA